MGNRMASATNECRRGGLEGSHKGDEKHGGKVEESRREKKKKWTDKKKNSFYDLLSISSSVNALALSSGVGSNKTQPFLRAP